MNKKICNASMTENIFAVTNSFFTFIWEGCNSCNWESAVMEGVMYFKLSSSGQLKKF